MAPPRVPRKVILFPGEASSLARATRPAAAPAPSAAGASASSSSASGEVLAALRGLLASQRSTEAKLEEQIRLHWMLLLAQNPLPVTRIQGSFKGSALGSTDAYVELFKNRNSWPLAIRVAAEFNGAANPGTQVKLAFSTDGSDEQVADYLGSTANAPSYNKRITDPLILNPGATLYINTADTGFALDASDVFRLRIFDPGDFLTADAFPSR